MRSDRGWGLPFFISLGLLVLALVLLAPLPALAQDPSAALRRFGLEITPDLTTHEARYRLRLEYQVTGGEKREGFKYVGKAQPHDVRAYDENNGELSIHSSLESSSGEYRLDFRMPPRDKGGAQILYVEFRQELLPLRSWSGVQLDVPWAHRFKIPVNEMSVAAELPEGADVPGWRCRPSARGVACLRATPGIEPVSLTLPRPLPAGDQAWLALSLLGTAGLCGAALWRRRARLLRDKGVLPPAAPEAYPDNAQPYRAPPPLPVAGKPVLPESEGRALRNRAVLGIGALLLGGVSLASLVSGSSLSLAGLFGGLLLGAAVLTAIFLSVSGWWWIPMWIAIVPAWIAATGNTSAVWFFGTPLAFYTVYDFAESMSSGSGGGKRRAGAVAASGGGSSSGGSSYSGGTSSCSSSSSSCSSGSSSCSSGGSSCGGGGGSSCGGGGGGGGCGG